MINNTLKWLLAIMLSLAGCKAVQDEGAVVIAEIPTVIVTQAQEVSYTPTLDFSGTVYANREANLGAALPGKVERIFYSEGSTVNKGDLIAELSDEMLTQAEVENQALRKDYERVKRLKEKESISEMEYDHLKAKMEASDAKTEMIRKNTRVHAPFSGTIVERMMEEGEIYFINPGLDPGYSMRSGIVRLMQLNPVVVKFDLNEKDLAAVKVGQQAIITLDAYPERTFYGKISSIKPMLSTMTRTAPAEIIIDNPDGDLKPGMFARVTMQLPEQNGLFVPMKCISRVPGTAEDYVFTIRSGVANRVRIQRVVTIGERVAVTGIQPNDTIIAEGKSRVIDGQEVVTSTPSNN